MRLIILILLLTFCFSAFALSPGSEIKIAQSGIDQATRSFIDYIRKKFQSISLPDVSKKHINIHDIVLDEFSIDSQKTGIKLQPNGDIAISVGGFDASLSGKFKAKWSIFHTSGTIKAKARDASVSINLAVSSENGQPRIANKGVNADLGKLDISVHGSIISWILDWIIDMFKSKIKDSGRDSIVKMLNEKVQQLSDKVVKIATQKALKGKLDGFFVGYGLTSNPSVANSALTIPTETQFWFKDHKDERKLKSSGPYPFGAPAQMVCADIDTNLVVGSMAYAFNVSKKGEFVVDKDVFKSLPPVVEQFFECDCTSPAVCLVDYIPALKEHCPKGGRVKIEAKANVQENLYFNNSGIFTLASGNGSYLAVLPDGNETLLFNMEADVGLRLLQNVTFNDWTLKGTLEVFYTKLSAHSPLVGDIDVKILDKIWNFVLKDVAEKVANGYLESGLPLPQLDFATFSKTQLIFNGQFMRFCTDVSITWDKILS